MTVQLCCFQHHFFLLGIPLRLVDQPEIYLGAGHDAALFRSAAEGVQMCIRDRKGSILQHLVIIVYSVDYQGI